MPTEIIRRKPKHDAKRKKPHHPKHARKSSIIHSKINQSHDDANRRVKPGFKTPRDLVKQHVAYHASAHAVAKRKQHDAKDVVTKL